MIHIVVEPLFLNDTTCLGELHDGPSFSDFENFIEHIEHDLILFFFSPVDIFVVKERRYKKALGLGSMEGKYFAL